MHFKGKGGTLFELKAEISGLKIFWNIAADLWSNHATTNGQNFIAIFFHLTQEVCMDPSWFGTLLPTYVLSQTFFITWHYPL